MGWTVVLRNYSNRAKLATIVGFMVVIMVSVLVFNFTDKSGKTRILLSAFPSDTSITIGGDSIKTGTQYLDPGIYELNATKDGFEDYSETIVIEDTEKIITVLMRPQTDEALQWSKDNEDEYNRVFGLAQAEAAEMGDTFNRRNPIAIHLPYKTFFYSVGYRMDQSDPSGNSIIIEIDARDGYRQAAIYRIRQLGFDPTDFSINFRDYENPFPL